MVKRLEAIVMEAIIVKAMGSDHLSNYDAAW